MNELIQQVHDELSDQSKNLATFKESMIREVNDSRDQTLIALTMLNRWKAEFDNLALVQACSSEFMSMQTTLDNVYLQSLKQDRSKKHGSRTNTDLDSIDITNP